MISFCFGVAAAVFGYRCIEFHDPSARARNLSICIRVMV